MITNNSPFEMLYLLQQQTTDTTTSGLKLNVTSSRAVITIWGNWDTNTKIKLQVNTVPNIDNIYTWIDVKDLGNSFTDFTEDQTVTIRDYVKGQSIRAVVTDSGAATSINCTLQVIY
jgi:hypothetical protein